MKLRGRIWRTKTLLWVGVLIVLMPGIANAQHFYAGKTITVIQGTEAAGS